MTKRSSGTSLQLADVARELEEGHQPGALARPERVMELLEVARQEAGRVAVALARLMGEPLGLGARDSDGVDERGFELLQPRRAPARARPRPRTPWGAPSAPARAGRGRSAASDPRRPTEARRRRSGASRPPGSPSGHMPRLGKEHLRQDDRGRALGRDRDRPDVLERRARDELDRVDRPLRGDAQARQEAKPVGVPRVLDRRDRRDVDSPASSRRLSSVGTPLTSSTSASSR